LYDRSLVAGDEFTREIEKKLSDARLVLLVVTSRFLASTWVGKEVRRALFSYEQRQGRVILLILESCPWQKEAFGKLQALPRGGRPVGSWQVRSEALADIVAGISKAVDELALPMHSPKLAIFTTDDLREMIEKIERNIGVIRRANSAFVVMPAQPLLETAELETRLKEFQTELRARGELL